MNTEIFIIKSLYVQNAIMLAFLGITVSFLIYSIFKRKPKHIAAFTIWVFLVLWFFNSPFFGFSVVTVGSQGIKLDYGILSIRNDVLPLDSEWKIETYMSGIRKNKRLYFISIVDRQSMKVRGVKDLRLLEKIGESIERVKAKRFKE